MNLSHTRKNTLITSIISKVAARPNIWARNDADYGNRGYITRMFKEIEMEIQNELGLTMLGDYLFKKTFKVINF